MSSLFDFQDANFWTVVLCLAVSVAILSFTAVAMFFWRRQPTKKDDLQRHKLHERLTQLTAEAHGNAKEVARSR